MLFRSSKSLLAAVRAAQEAAQRLINMGSRYVNNAKTVIANAVGAAGRAVQNVAAAVRRGADGVKAIITNAVTQARQWWNETPGKSTNTLSPQPKGQIQKATTQVTGTVEKANNTLPNNLGGITQLPKSSLTAGSGAGEDDTETKGLDIFDMTYILIVLQLIQLRDAAMGALNFLAGFARAVDNSLLFGQFDRYWPKHENAPLSYALGELAGYGVMMGLGIEGMIFGGGVEGGGTVLTGGIGAVAAVLAGVAIATAGAVVTAVAAIGMLTAAENVVLALERSPYPPGRRVQNDSKKDAYEKVKGAGNGKEPIHHPDGEHGPHYHPDIKQPKDWTLKSKSPHDHYYYPKGK